jgi:folylpolyglutamate synthase/dihydropteroate synthase
VKDAFKNIPAKTDELQLQGFMVENRYFVELRMIFGARTALAHYDILGNTIEKLAISESGIPRQFVGRAVENQPVATPANSTWGKKFTDSYRRICKEVNVELTEDCEDCDKVFSDTTRGKVLGIWFDSEKLSWKLPAEKALTTRELINEVVSKKNVSLNELQSLLGRLNFVCMMCPFLKAFRFNMN